MELDKSTYVYGDARFPHHITQVRNKAGVGVNNVTYDGRGRAVTSSLWNGVDQSTVSYGEAAAITTRTVTNALGKQSTYRFARSGAAFRFAGVDGVASTNCPASANGLTYDASGFLLSQTDEEGRVTTFTRDAQGQPLTTTRGSGTPDTVTTTTTWHPTLRVPTQIVEPGRTTAIAWTAGKITSVTQTDTTSHTVPYSTNGQSRTWLFGYSGSLLTSVDGPLAGPTDKTTYTYGTDGYLRTVTNPVGHVTTVNAVNGRGQPTSITDPNNVVTAIGYDGMGHVTSITNDQGGTPSTTSFTYNSNWNVSSITRPGGAVLTFTWDPAWRVTKLSNAAGESINYTYDGLGGQTKIEVKDGSTITAQRSQTFDELGRLLKTIKADASAFWTFGYDKTGNKIQVTDPRSQSWTSGFDALDRLVTQTDPEAATVTLARNGVDDVTSYKDPRNNSTSYVRNGFGDVIREVNPDTGTTTYVYDARGLVTQKTDARGYVATYAYDAAGRQTARTFQDTAAENIAFTWDGTTGGNKGKGRITRMVDTAGSSDFVYDARGNVLSETRTNASSVYVTAYGYDLADRLTSITYPSGRIVTYVRDAMGRVTSVTTKANASATSVTLASGINWLPMAGTDVAAAAPWTPDLSGGLAARNSIPVTDGSGMNAGTAAQLNALPGTEVLTSDIVQSLTYGNGLGLFKNFTQDNQPYQYLVEGGGTSVMNRGLASSDGVMVTQAWDGLDATETQAFTYSPAGRLASADGAYGAQAWTYDTVGNRLTETKNGVTTNWAYPASGNRLSTVKQGSTTLRLFAYNNNGALSSDTRGSTVYSYGMRRSGAFGLLSVGGVGTASYINDGFNRLAVRNILTGPTQGVRHIVPDIFGHVLAEHLVGTGMQREYVWLGDMPIATIDATASPAKLYYVHVDHLDRPALMTDASKAIVWKASYEPFGAVRQITGAASTDLRFPGQWFQLETGLAYNWNRHYDPTLGRYIQPDPLKFVDGPNMYAYAAQSPTMKVDPTGKYGLGGALFGAGLNFGLQFGGRIAAGRSWEEAINCVDWSDVALSALVGAVSPGLLGGKYYIGGDYIKYGTTNLFMQGGLKAALSAGGYVAKRDTPAPCGCPPPPSLSDLSHIFQ